MKKLGIMVVLAVVLTGVAGPAMVSPLNAAPAAQSTSSWTGQYYANANLQGTPALTREDPSIDFGWGTSPPAPGLPADNFSVRWTRWFWIDAPGTWTFAALTDDGVRLFVDDTLLIDAWTDQPLTMHTATINLTQAFHLVRMEYYDRTGTAEARLAVLSASYPDWQGEYFDNADLTDPPVFVRNDSSVSFDFGASGPGGQVSGTNFSVRWTRRLYLNAGKYRFTTMTDDGARLWVDGQLLVDRWRDQVPTRSIGDIALGDGNHLVKMEYYNSGGVGMAQLTWTLAPGSADAWRGEYFDNPGLAGTPALVREAREISFNWGTTAPGAGIPSGTNWSARFTSQQQVSLAGYYTVSAAADDGVRVWVDNTSLIDEWHDSPGTPYSAAVYLTAGKHDWRVEFYQHTGAASLAVQITPGMTELPIASSAAGDVIIDDGAAGFFKGGPASTWREFSGGYGKHALSIPNSTFSRAESTWARWYPRLARPGIYEVFIYIPAKLPTTRSARYWIHHAGSNDSQRLSQALYADQWVSLGTYYFAATGDEYLALSDNTFEPYQSTVIAVDAARFVMR